ncbi:MAG: transposase [Spirochaetales bacterium]|nr:transposase [Spirochaetales bacterium]
MDARREHGMVDATFCNRRSEYGGMEAIQVKLKELEDENRRLKHIYAELSLVQSAEGHRRKKGLRPADKRTLVDYLGSKHQASILAGDFV